MGRTKGRRRTIVVSAKDYQPTKAELEEPIRVDVGDMTVEEAMRRLLRPVKVREVSSAKRREQR